MKKNQIKAILVNQTKRRNTILAFVCVIFVIFLLSLSFFLIYINRSKNYYVNYDETSNIDYKVFLKDNNFFEEEYLGANRQYIASLIDYVNASFNYNLSVSAKDVLYKYSYRIDALVNVKQKNTDFLLYTSTTNLIKEKEETTNLRNVSISENIKIDYNYYNDLIKRFVNVYELQDIESTLTVNMYIDVIGSCEDFETDASNQSIISLTIPLTTKTMAIDLSDNLVNSENNMMQCKSIYSNNVIFIVFGCAFTIFDIILFVLLFKYIIKTRTAENIYERELKKILNNYGSYIQTLNSEFNFEKFQLLKLDTFTDMLEIRDTIRQPILMKENNNKDGAYFVIPSDRILYVYRMKVSDIEKKLKNG